MHIVKLPWGNRIDVFENSNLSEVKKIIDNEEISIRIDRKVTDKNFLKKFSEIFIEVSELSVSAYGEGVYYDFLYNMKKIQSLYLHTMYPINFEHLSQLKNLSLWWNKKMISNFDKLENLEHLSVTEFDEKDLTKLSALTNLKSLSFATTKIKSLKGIENLTNLKVLSLGAVRSLTDISDIKYLKNLKYLEFDICWKLKDFSPVADLKKLEVLKLLDCKNLSNIQFVKQMPDLKQLSALGTTVINDFDTTPAEHLPVFFHNGNKKYNKQYPEKAIKEKVMGASRFLKDE